MIHKEMSDSQWNTIVKHLHDSTKFIDTMENISEFVDNSLMQTTISAYADKGTMRNKLGIISDAAKLTVAFHTKRTQRALHKTGVKNIMAKQGLSLRDSSHGSSVAFTERQ